ncbi:MAG: histidine phosphatase family protein [Patescibacteria group bacterium]|nr:histidine phosphatase family protein [Patescibacteria group bacterium]
MKLFLLRHGESTSDIEDRYGGDYDDHLTEKGLQQAREQADKLVGKGIEVIFSSPRIRATESAGVLKSVLDCELKVVDDLRERNAYGVLTGMVKSEAKQKHADKVELLKHYSYTIEGAESYEALCERVRNVMDKLTSTQHQIMAILTHGGFIRCFLREVMKMGAIKSLGDCAIIGLEKNEDGYKIISIENVQL